MKKEAQNIIKITSFFVILFIILGLSAVDTIQNITGAVTGDFWLVDILQGTGQATTLASQSDDGWTIFTPTPYDTCR